MKKLLRIGINTEEVLIIKNNKELSRIIAKDFLMNNKLSFIDTRIRSILLTYTNNNPNNESILSILELIEMNENIFNNIYGEGQFFFIGLNEFTNPKTKEKYYHSINMRIINLKGKI